MQQHIEWALFQLPAQVIESTPASSFIKFNEFDALQAAEQSMFQFSDDPGDVGGGPVVLNGPDHRYNVRGVAKRRKPQDANVFRLLNC